MTVNSPKSAYAVHAQELDGLLRIPPWYVDNATLTVDGLAISGWALPFPGASVPTGFRINGQSFDRVEYPSGSRPDVREVFWFRDGSERSPFFCYKAIQSGLLFPDGMARLEYVYEESGAPIYPHHSFFLPADLLEAMNGVPDGDSMSRVTGNDVPYIFVQDGFTTFVKLCRVLEEKGVPPLSEARSLLDWGCGCGRVTRWFIKKGPPQLSVHGADIDAANIRWCQQHLSGAQFSLLPLHPPSDLPSAHFDLALGMSVFTHLSEEVQFEWLGELQRVMRPGGIALMTIHGEASVARASPSVEWLRQLRSHGIDASQPDRALGGVIQDGEYYRGTFHTQAYVRERWSKYFEVVAIEDAFLGNNQDLVILRRA